MLRVASGHVAALPQQTRGVQLVSRDRSNAERLLARMPVRLVEVPVLPRAIARVDTRRVVREGVTRDHRRAPTRTARPHKRQRRRVTATTRATRSSRCGVHAWILGFERDVIAAALGSTRAPHAVYFVGDRYQQQRARGFECDCRDVCVLHSFFCVHSAREKKSAWIGREDTERT